MKSHLLIHALLSSIASAQQLNILHRIYHPLVPDSPFSQRAVINLSGTPTIQHAPTFLDDLKQFSSLYQGLPDEIDRTLYQVALELEATPSGGYWDLSSVKACHLSQATTESFILRTLDQPGALPFALDYFVGPVPQDGSCVKSTSDSASPFHAFSIVVGSGRFNASISVHSSHLPPLPTLKTPPPIAADGTPEVPAAEKTFFQKYWVYIVAVMLAILLSGGGEEEKQN